MNPDFIVTFVRYSGFTGSVGPYTLDQYSVQEIVKSVMKENTDLVSININFFP